MINVELKGGTVKEFESGVTPAEIAKSIGMGLYKSVCCARVDGNVVDLRTPITKDCRVDLLTFDEPDGKRRFGTQHHIFLHRQLSAFIQTQSALSAQPLTTVFTMILRLKSLFQPRILKNQGRDEENC